MTNGEKFKTADERNRAFMTFCSQHSCNSLGMALGKTCPLGYNPLANGANCRFYWLDLEYKEPEPELKPCPFCGTKADIHKTQLFGGYSCYISCPNCNVSTPIVFSEDLALAIWNRRAK